MHARAKTFIAMGGLLAIASACIGSAFVIVTATRVEALDATPQQVLSPTTEAGTEVWLRGMRERDYPVTLSDGRILYPTAREPRVMVECGADDCAGALVGRVEELTLDGALPSAWPRGAGRDVRVVRVGVWGTARNANARLGATVALASLMIASLAAFVLVLQRRGERALSKSMPGWPVAAAGAGATLLSIALVGIAAVAWSVHASAYRKERVLLFLRDPTRFLTGTGMMTKLIVGVLIVGLVLGALLIAVGAARELSRTGRT